MWAHLSEDRTAAVEGVAAAEGGAVVADDGGPHGTGGTGRRTFRAQGIISEIVPTPEKVLVMKRRTGQPCEVVNTFMNSYQSDQAPPVSETGSANVHSDASPPDLKDSPVSREHAFVDPKAPVIVPESPTDADSPADAGMPPRQCSQSQLEMQATVTPRHPHDTEIFSMSAPSGNAADGLTTYQRSDEVCVAGGA